MILNKEVVCINITDRILKLAVVKITGKEFKVLAVGKKELPQTLDTNDSTFPNFAEDLINLQKELKIEISSKQAVIGIPESKIFLRVINSSENPSDLKNIILEKLGDSFPFEREEAALFWKQAQSKQFQVVAIKSAVLDSIKSSLDSAKIRYSALVPLPLILTKLTLSKAKPHLIISLDEPDITYILSTDFGAAFSTTNKFVKTLSESQEDFINWTRETLKFSESEKLPIENVYITGTSETLAKDYLNQANINSEIIYLPISSNFKGIDEYKSTIALSLYDEKAINLIGKETFAKSFFSQRIETTDLKSGKSSRKFIKLIILILLVILLATVAYFFLNRSPGSEKISNQEVPQATSESKSASPSAQLPKTPIATETAKKKEAEEKPTLKRTDLKIRILNGNGVRGLATEAKKIIEELGYTVASVGNADNYDFQKTVLQLKASKSSYKDLLTNDLKSHYTVIVGVNVSENESFDALITLGAE